MTTDEISATSSAHGSGPGRARTPSPRDELENFRQLIEKPLPPALARAQPRKPLLDVRAALAILVHGARSPRGVDVHDVRLAQSAVAAWRAQEEAVRLIEQLFAELQDDGILDSTLARADQIAEGLP